MTWEPTTRRKRLRGRAVVAIRRGVTGPVSHRVPLAVVRRYHRLRRRVRPARYTDADPVGLLSVDPNRIERSLLETAPARPQWGRVVGGNWERESESFADRQVPCGLYQRFVEDVPWRETALYEAFRDQLRRFGNAWEYTSIEGFDRRCREIDSLYESIRQEGYRRQAELHDRGRTIGVRADEINVDIGRKGTIYWRTYGQHRLAIAQLLDLESVPVVVQRRHREWQAVREQVRNRGVDSVSEEYRTHPDLRGLIEEAPT